MLRKIGGTVLGILIAAVVIMAVEWLGHQAFPPPDGINVNDPEDREIFLAGAPFWTLLPVPLAWFLGVLAGGWVGDTIGRSEWPRWIVAALILFGVIFNVWTINHPGWLIALGIAAPLLGAWLAGRLPRPAPSDRAAD